MDKTSLQKDFRAYTKDVLGEVAMKCLSISDLESLCIEFILQQNSTKEQKNLKAYAKDVLGEAIVKDLTESELESLCIDFILQRNSDKELGIMPPLKILVMSIEFEDQPFGFDLDNPLVIPCAGDGFFCDWEILTERKDVLEWCEHVDYNEGGFYVMDVSYAYKKHKTICHVHLGINSNKEDWK